MSAADIALESDPAGGLGVSLGGNWLLGQALPGPDPVLDRLRGTPKPSRVSFEAGRLGEWDTGLITALIAIHRSAEANAVDIDSTGLPAGASRLLALAFAVKEREGARRQSTRLPFIDRVGESALATWESSRALLVFIGEASLSAVRFLRGQAIYLKSDLALYIQDAGATAFPIVSLISFLIGMIFAFVGVKQLGMFGAGIYTADLVAVAMVREMAPIMTAIIMAGRTGASYAAQIGTMKVNEEIDALSTLGFNPVDFLVTPRIIALILMMPLLTLYSSLMGILGGMLVGYTMLDISLIQYAEQTMNALELNSLFGGLFKCIVYGALVAVAGCYQGMACGNSALAVGECTTKAVVMGIVLVVVSASMLTIIYINLGI
jgi:phospholipid/cholesterol/gamma-HCH transport system permease protein